MKLRLKLQYLKGKKPLRASFSENSDTLPPSMTKRNKAGGEIARTKKRLRISDPLIVSERDFLKPASIFRNFHLALQHDASPEESIAGMARARLLEQISQSFSSLPGRLQQLLEPRIPLREPRLSPCIRNRRCLLPDCSLLLPALPKPSMRLTPPAPALPEKLPSLPLSLSLSNRKNSRSPQLSMDRSAFAASGAQPGVLEKWN